MPPKIDEKYVTALNNYSKSLEKVVEILQQQVKNKDTDILETMLKNMDGEKIKKIVEDLKEVNETTKRIESKQDKILEEIKSLKKQKESGMFGQVSDTKNKNKIIDGVKIIALIAGGVLAIGLAFKIIGHVDVMSVLSLGISITIIAAAFAYINEKIKEPDPKRTALISGMLVIVATAMTISSWILSMASTISLAQSLSVGFTALAVGGALYLMTLSLSKTDLTPKTIFKMLLLPFLAPIVSMAIVVSSSILSHAKPLDMKVIGSVLFTSIALGIALYGITKALSHLTWKGAMIAMLGKGAILTILIGAVAGGIVLASMLFSKISPITLMQGVTAILVAVTLGIVMFLFGKVIKHTKDLKAAQVASIGLTILTIVAIIPIASKILSFTNVWDFKFALKLAVTSLAIGVSVLAITPAFFILKKANIGYKDIGKISLSILAIAVTIAASSWILSMGMYNGNYPDWKWSLQVGLSIGIFGVGMWAINKFMGGVDLKKMVKLSGMVLIIAGTVMLSSWILSVGNYSNYPKLEWIEGVGLSIAAFGLTMFLLGKFGGPESIEMMFMGGISALLISATIMLSSWILSVGNYSNYPQLEWAEGVGLSLFAFGISMVGLGLFVSATLGLGLGVLALGAMSVLIIAATIVEVSRVISKGTYSNGPTLEWVLGTGALLIAVGITMVATALIPNKILEWGAESVLIIAQTIVDVSKKIVQGDYSNGPNKDWATGTGMIIAWMGTAMLATAFIPNVVLKWGRDSIMMVVQTIIDISKKLQEGSYTGGPSFDWIVSTGMLITTVGATLMLFASAIVVITLGSISALLAVNTIVEISRILSTGKYNVVPTDWIISTGLLLVSTAGSLLLIGAMVMGTLGLGLVALMWGSIAALIIATTIVGVSKILSHGNYTGGPKAEWIKNINDSITSFINLSNSGLNQENIENLEYLVDTIVSIAKKFNKKIFTEASVEINKFSISLRELTNNVPTKEITDRISSLSDSISKISSIGMSTSLSIYLLSRSLKDLGDTIGDMDMSTFDKLTKFSSSFTAISLIDNLKLQQAIDTIKSKRLDIKAVIDDSPKFSNITPYEAGNTTNINSPFMNTEKISNPLNDLVIYNKNIDKNIQELLKIQKDSTNNPQDYTVNVAPATRFHT